MQTIPRSVASKIGWYVYLYSDPRTGKAFYVGKGKGSRAVAHLCGKGRSRKACLVRKLMKAGREPRIDILAHGLPNEETAFRVEAGVIDALGLDLLTNEVRGWRSLELGRMPLKQLVAYYRPRPVKVTHKAILIRINRLYRHGMSPQELYEATRGVWRVNVDRAKEAVYAMAVFEGVVREVYEIGRWHPAGSTKYRSRSHEDVDEPGRWEFTGKPAPASVRRRYVDRSVASHFPYGLQSPVRYVNA